MTINYNATKWRCRDYFWGAINEELGANVDFNCLQKDVSSFIEDFYYFIGEAVFEDLFRGARRAYLASCENSVFLGGTNINLAYFNFAPEPTPKLLKVGRRR